MLRLCDSCCCLILSVDNLYQSDFFFSFTAFPSVDLCLPTLGPCCHFHLSLFLFPMAVLSFPIPMAFLSIPIPHPLPAALSRSAISHDMSGASLEHSTPVTVLSPARQEPGKKPVTQKPRRRRRAAQRYEHAQEQGRGRRSDFHPHVPRPRCSETDTDSSDSSSTRESHWIQAKRRAQVKFRLSRRRRRNNKTSGNLGESSAPNEINLVHLGSKDKKHTKLTSCESCSLNLHGAKGTTYEGCGVSLSRGSSDSKRPSRKQQESREGDHHRDPQLLHRCGQNETTIKRRFSGTDFSTEMLAVKGGKSAGEAGFQEPPSTDHDGSDHLHACRSVSPEKDLMPPKYTSSRCELHVCVSPALKT